MAFGTAWIVFKHTWKSSALRLPSARRVETRRQTSNSESYFQGLPHTTRFLPSNLNALLTDTHHRTHFWVARLTSHFRVRMMSRAASVGGLRTGSDTDHRDGRAVQFVHEPLTHVMALGGPFAQAPFIIARPLAFIGDEIARLRSRPTQTREQPMATRRHFKHTTPLKDRLMAFAQETREKAALLPPGSERRDLLKKASQADTTAHLDDWINSPGLQPPLQPPK